jgi:hypothetical protein
MSPGNEVSVRSQKLGSENAIVVQLPAGRFLGRILPHHTPPVDEQGRYGVMLLAQDCTRCSFGDGEAGPTQELHLWLQVGSSTEDPPIENADVMLPSQHWLALAAATNNPVVEANLRSFGFDPSRLASVDHRSGGGSLQLGEGTRLEWTITGPGHGPATLGVHHAMVMPDDGPDAAGHQVAALLSGAVMGHPGELLVQGSALEPFLLSGERWPALVHRMPKLEADVVWRRRSKAS